MLDEIETKSCPNCGRKDFEEDGDCLAYIIYCSNCDEIIFYEENPAKYPF